VQTRAGEVCNLAEGKTINLSTSKVGTILELSDKERGSTSPAGHRSNGPNLEIRARPIVGANTQQQATRNLFSREEQERLLHNATTLVYRRSGTTVFSEGEAAGFLYFIDEGVIRISRCAENGRRQILAFRVPGDLLGRPEDGRYVNSAETVGPAKVYRVAWLRMQQMMLADPQLQLHLLTKVADDFRQAEHRIMTLGQQNTCQRLASFILDLMVFSEFFEEKRSLLTLPVNRFDLADYLGTVTKSSERAFARLEREGLIRRVASRTIEIMDVAGLQRVQREQRRGHQ
jgi:CRP-like cAMP-binding protein